MSNRYSMTQIHRRPPGDIGRHGDGTVNTPATLCDHGVTGLVGGSGRLRPLNWWWRRRRGPVELDGGCGQLPGQSGEQPPTLAAGQRDQAIVPAGVIGPRLPLAELATRPTPGLMFPACPRLGGGPSSLRRETGAPGTYLRGAAGAWLTAVLETPTSRLAPSRHLVTSGPGTGGGAPEE